MHAMLIIKFVLCMKWSMEAILCHELRPRKPLSASWSRTRANCSRPLVEQLPSQLRGTETMPPGRSWSHLQISVYSRAVTGEPVGELHCWARLGQFWAGYHDPANGEATMTRPLLCMEPQRLGSSGQGAHTQPCIGTACLYGLWTRVVCFVFVLHLNQICAVLPPGSGGSVLLRWHKLAWKQFRGVVEGKFFSTLMERLNSRNVWQGRAGM